MDEFGPSTGQVLAVDPARGSSTAFLQEPAVVASKNWSKGKLREYARPASFRLLTSLEAGVELDEQIGRREPDPEVQALLVASAGLNLAVDFLPGSLGYTSPSRRLDPRAPKVPGLLFGMV